MGHLDVPRLVIDAGTDDVYLVLGQSKRRCNLVMSALYAMTQTYDCTPPALRSAHVFMAIGLE